jgi:DNA mismatch repair ATPase MutS
MNYQEREKHFRQEADQLKKRYNLLSLGRLLYFVFAIALIIFLAQQHWSLALSWTILAIALFLWMILRHRKVQEAELHHRHLAEVNRQEQAALDYHFSEFPSGEQYADPLHPYSGDLDLFGPYSIFQFCNRTVTAAGSNQLAEWLKDAATPEVVLERQKAVQELGPQLDWRQHFRAYGMAQADEQVYQLALQKWMDEPFFVYGKKWMRWALWLLPIWGIAALVVILPNYPLVLVLLAVLPAALLLRQTLQQVNRTLEYTAKAESWLLRYGILIQQIEKLEVKTPFLQNVQAHFRNAEAQFGASQAIRQLSYYLGQLNVRNNPFAIFLNLIAVWDLQWVYQLEKWKIQHREDLSGWFAALGEMDALSSLANLHYNQPDWVFPALHSEASLSAKQLGHPLIPSNRRIGNDLQMPTQRHLKLLTGSNMAGKSTWLRSLGVNLVLAQMGAPVCAKALSMPPLLVFTGMRTQDDLSASASSFYAELRRLRAMLDAVIVQEGQSSGVFFLLDEILKGTNSRDRHQGSRALMLQLLRHGSAGFIATHDLDLTAMEAENPGLIQNVCMEVDIQGDELYFDYTLKPGISQSFNASVLMRRMGIGVE